MRLSKKELTLIGASLYICEGAKLRVDNRGWKQYAVDFTNTNPDVIKVFLRFLREILHAEESRIKAQLFVYPDIEEAKTLEFWSSLTKIPVGRFNKIIHLSQRSGRFKPSKFGTLKIRYHHKKHFLKIQDIIAKVFGGVG